MEIEEFASQVELKFSHESNNCNFLSPIEGLFLIKYIHSTDLHATLYNPLMCLVLQGRKETIIGDRRVSFGAGESLIVSHDIPVVSQITEASEEKPYLAIVLSLDLGILRNFHEEIDRSELETQEARSVDVNITDKNLLAAIYRYLLTTYDSLESKVLAPLILKEIHFRLLRAPHGKILRGFLQHNSHASNIAKVITEIRRKYKEPLSVPDLAKSVGMSTSSFHYHFKVFTETTPLQYQKNLRLLEARRLLITEGYSVTSVALEVGYESPNQFSREYTRRFGTSPRDELSKTI